MECINTWNALVQKNKCRTLWNGSHHNSSLSKTHSSDLVLGGMKAGKPHVLKILKCPEYPEMS